MAKSNYRRVVFLDRDAVRLLCMRRKWYDAGTNEDYEKMIKSCCYYSGDIARLELIATDIDIHTSKELDIAEVIYMLIKYCENNLISPNNREEE